MTHQAMNDDDARWSLTGQAIAWIVVGEVVLAIVAITQDHLHRPRILVVAAAAAILSALLTARSRMPAPAKGGLIALLCAALLSLAAAQDPFGLRAVDRRVAAAIDATDTSASGPPDPVQAAPSAATSQIGLRGRGDIASTVFASDLASQVALKSGDDYGTYRVDGLIDIASAAAGDTYRLTWSLSDNDQTLWCGRIVALGQSRDAALDSFSTTIAAALRRARQGRAACG